MKILKSVLLMMVFICCTISSSGCWNYREIDKVAIAAGVALDRGVNHKYQLTIEIIDVSGGKDTNIKAKAITIEGDTIFDAVRNAISIAGKRVYWSHAKVVIISKEIAADGILDILDWFNRDDETRADMHILVSRADSAGIVFQAMKATEEVKSFDLDNIIESERSLSKTPYIQIWEVTNHVIQKGIDVALPAIDLIEKNGEKTALIAGAAIFKKDKLIGFINEEESKDLLFVQDQIKGGVIVDGNKENEKEAEVSLEITRSKTVKKPVIDRSDIKMDVKIETEVSIDEVKGDKDFSEEEGRLSLESDTENMLKKRIEAFIKKVQSEYGADIFGFGAQLRQDKPRVWDSVKGDWDNKFRDIRVNVSAKVHIRNSATLSKKLKEDEI